MPQLLSTLSRRLSDQLGTFVNESLLSVRLKSLQMGAHARNLSSLGGFLPDESGKTKTPALTTRSQP